jgi:ferredoxin
MKIIHDREKCIGCGACVAICPNFWEMTEGNKSKLKGSVLNAEKNYELAVEDCSCNQDAADGCPVSIIYIEK